MAKIKVGVNGYGTIGKRVATAVSMQDDMELVGVTKTRPTFEARTAVAAGIALYVPAENVEKFDKAGIKVAGTIDDLKPTASSLANPSSGNIFQLLQTQHIVFFVHGFALLSCGRQLFNPVY
jgi:glyceraldehyde-3-phosphate dehydrogenase (NAD(P))